MSLRFVFGGSGFGKSTRIYTEILDRAKKEPERNFLIIVPDQFTMQTQKELVTHPANGQGGILNIDVLSFGRLSHRIFTEVGKRETPVLDDTGKSLVLRKVAGNLKEELTVMGGNLERQGYIHEVKSAISEFMQYGISAEDVGKLMEYAKKRGALYYKLKDLQVLYAGFLSYIRDKFITTEETLDLLRDALQKSEIVKGSVVVFDGFTGFTPIQNRVIQELMRLTKEVIMTVTIDPAENPFEADGEQRLFHLSKKTVSDLCRLAAEADVPRGEDICLAGDSANRFSHNPAIAHLERALFRYPVRVYGEEADAIHLYTASGIGEEARQTGLLIQKLVRERGYEYRDIAVVAGDLSAYAGQIQAQFELLSIPCFVDRTRGIVLNPLTEYIKSALGVLIKDFSYESVFKYLRSGMSSLSPEEIDELENYCVQTGIRGKRSWAVKFTRRTAQMQDDTEPLERLDAMRERLVGELYPLLASPCRTAGDYVQALYDFLVQNGASEKMVRYEAFFKEQDDQVREREYAQVYRLVMELLEQIMELVGDEQMALSEFLEILEAGFDEIEVGAIPQNVDRVLVGDIERTRLKPVKVLFFVGVNDGNIPRGVGGGGIISDIDREFLRQSELELAPSPRQQMYIQRLYLYLNLTKPSDLLYLSYAKVDGEGRALRPAYLIGVLQQIFPSLLVECPECQSEVTQIMTPASGLLRLANGLREYAGGFMTEENGGKERERMLRALYGSYEGREDYRQILKLLTDAAFYRYEEGSLAKEVARALYGQTLLNSVSRLETYAACAYRHFLRYGMSLKEREEFDFQDVDMGNMFHGVLEGFSNKLGESGYTWFDFPEEFAKRTVGDVLEMCAAQYGDTILYANARNEYALRRMRRILNRTVMTLQYQLKKGSFVPESYEVSFSSVSDLESVNIALSEDERMQLLGRIDRLDVCETQDKIYVKVVDYKSGNRRFDLAALYYGLQLQLVVYMNAALDRERKLHPDKEVLPAAMLYYHVADPAVEAKEELTPEEVNGRLLEELRTTGMVSAGEGIVALLDNSMTAKSDVIPVEYKKDGTFSSRSCVMSPEDLKEISGFADKKIREIGREILDGSIGINPYEKGSENACTYCSFKGVCGFEEGMPGYRFNRLKALSDEEAMDAIRGEGEGDGSIVHA